PHLPPARARAPALVFPSLWPEPLSRVLLEALALGTPIAAMDTGGSREILEDGRSGLLVANAAGLGQAVGRPAGGRGGAPAPPAGGAPPGARALPPRRARPALRGRVQEASRLRVALLTRG